jgi:hypothetical protein
MFELIKPKQANNYNEKSWRVPCHQTEVKLQETNFTSYTETWFYNCCAKDHMAI